MGGQTSTSAIARETVGGGETEARDLLRAIDPTALSVLPATAETAGSPVTASLGRGAERHMPHSLLPCGPVHPM